MAMIVMTVELFLVQGQLSSARQFLPVQLDSVQNLASLLAGFLASIITLLEQPRSNKRDR